MRELKLKYPNTKEFINQFHIQHPDLLKKMKDMQERTFFESNSTKYINDIIESSQKNHKAFPKASDLIAKLKSIPKGRSHANDYHDLILDILILLFSPQLVNPKKEQPINEKRKKVDIVFSNTAHPGFFSELSSIHKIKSPYIFFECKNYSEDLSNPELDQLAGRFGEAKGKFGIVVCRTNDNKAEVFKRCKDYINNNQYYIIVLEDDDIKKMLEYDNLKQVDDYMRNKLKELILS